MALGWGSERLWVPRFPGLALTFFQGFSSPAPQQGLLSYK